MRKNRRQTAFSALESLEGRVFLSATALSRAVAYPTYQILHRAGVTSDGSASPSGGISASQMVQAYGVNAIQFGGVTGDGEGQTIALIDAYNDPDAASDLVNFDKYYGLQAPPTFTQLNENGGTSLPANAPTSSNGSWALEESLDIEWAHVMAPDASIILYEANSASDSDLISTAVVSAKNNANVTVVSMSFGGGEFSSETSLDSIFTSSHVTFCASAGDSGSPPDYPSISPNVVGVGGTTLSVSSNGTWQKETVWSDTGGGTSTYESEPAYQKSVQSTGHRTAPDIALDANPSTGVPVYDSYDEGSTTPWVTVGGTSLASPMSAGLMAIVNQGRVINGLPVMSTVSNPSATSTGEALTLLYQASKSDFHDITSGSNGTYSAGTGYDEVSGIGSPIANLLVPYMAGTKPTVTNFTASPNPVAAGSNITLAATVTDPDSTVSGVAFYEESNGISGLQTGSGGDTYLGAGKVINGQWTLTISSTGLTGTTTFYAVPTDASGVTGATASTTDTIATAALPAWLAPNSQATWNSSNNTLTVTGPTTIIADPGSNEPNITASGSSAAVTVDPATSPTDIHIGGIILTDGASLVMSDVDASQVADGTNASNHASDHNVLVIGTLGATNDPTILIDSTSKLDLGDNDLIVHTGSSDTGTADVQGYMETNELQLVVNLASEGRNVAPGGIYNGTWTGNGLTSSAAATADNDAGYERNILAVEQNSDMYLGGYSTWTVGSASETLGANDIIVKYTYNGDLNLDGAVDGNAATIFNTFYDNGASSGNTYAYGDLNGDGSLNGNDATIFATVYGNGLPGSGLPQL